MRKLAILTIASAAIALAGASSAFADFNGGGPVVKGGMCWVATSVNEVGYWKPCPPSPMWHHHHHHHHM